MAQGKIEYQLAIMCMETMETQKASKNRLGRCSMD